MSSFLRGASKKRTTESKVSDLEVSAAKSQKKFDLIDKALAENQDRVTRLHQMEVEKAQDLEKKIDQLKTTVDAAVDDIRDILRLSGIEDAHFKERLTNVQADVERLTDRLKQLETRRNSVGAAKEEHVSKTSPPAATTSSRKTDDPFGGKGNDYSPEVKKLIQEALDTLDGSDDDYQ